MRQLQTFLHKEIPLTKHMGLNFISYNGKELYLQAPLPNNINDKGSVFGGGSSALMIISAWSLIKLNCEQHHITADIVIHKNETTWQKAMYKDLLIKATFNDSYDFQEIKTIVSNNRHKRIKCFIELQDQDSNIYSTMTANYVIIAKKPTEEK